MKKINSLLLAIISTKLSIGILGLAFIFYSGKIFSMNFFPQKYESYQSDIYSYIYHMFLYGFGFWCAFICICLILFFTYEETVGKYNECIGNEPK